jgi:hypothetical protein
MISTILLLTSMQALRQAASVGRPDGRSSEDAPPDEMSEPRGATPAGAIGPSQH